MPENNAAAMFNELLVIVSSQIKAALKEPIAITIIGRLKESGRTGFIFTDDDIDQIVESLQALRADADTIITTYEE